MAAGRSATPPTRARLRWRSHVQAAAGAARPSLDGGSAGSVGSTLSTLSTLSTGSTLSSHDPALHVLPSSPHAAPPPAAHPAGGKAASVLALVTSAGHSIEVRRSGPFARGRRPQRFCPSVSAPAFLPQRFCPSVSFASQWVW